MKPFFLALDPALSRLFSWSRSVAAAWMTLTTLILVLILSPGSLQAADENGQTPQHQKRQLLITNSSSWKPFSYLNDAGEPSGILVDIWREYAKANRVDIRFILTDWQGSLDLVRNGQADIHAGLLWSREREHYLDYARELLGIESQLFFNQKLLGVEPDGYLMNGGEVGVVRGGYEESFVRQKYPRASVLTYASNELMLKAAFDDKLKVFVADLQVANFYLYTSREPARFIPVRHLYSAQIRPAVKEGNRALLEEIRQGLARIPDSEYQRILNRWMYVETVYPRYLLQSGLALLLLGILIYIVALRRTVAARTAELKAANAELAYWATTDGLTGITNRRAFMDALERTCDSRSYDSLTLLLFDIDNFKRINDNYGHHIGDEVINLLAQTVEKVMPDGAVFGRIGGEEFCIMLQGMTEPDAQTLTSMILKSVNQQPFATKAGKLAVSISIGAVYVGPGKHDAKLILADADRLMYQVKNSGRNDFLFRHL
ncbi:transporter substrate-binding domain-containing diguanylate cyclase [Shewanella carassii]|uniref:transporter substrate-binding domain-containing diguanylate cyclase n=1 Tax=Shewanella carassii TaxID=1987584 RepID=UPI001C822242|nr:sensor domain-containing diguanylate cyclase [Shewanella carassii]